MWLGSPIEQVSTDEQHLCCSRFEPLDTVIWKSRMKALKIPSEEAMEATTQRKQVQHLEISNQVDVGLDGCHLYNNQHTSLKLLTLKCTPTEVVRWNPFPLLDEIEKAHPDICKIQALKNGHHFYFQGRRVSLKNTSIIMKSNMGSTTHENSGSNIIGFNFGEKRA